MPVTPMCSKCGARHFNFGDCPTMFGEAQDSVPPWGLADHEKVVSIHDWQFFPKDDPPLAA